MMHTSDIVSRAAAQECLDLYDRDPEPARHHRLSSHCLAVDSPIRGDIERFIRGAALSDLSVSTLKAIVPLKFISVSERTIESKHASVATNLSGKRRKRSPVTVSLFSGRLRELTFRLDSSPAFLESMLQHLDVVRNARDQARVFQLLRHPLLQELLSHERPDHSTAFESRVRAIIYHCDAQQQYMNFGEVGQEMLERHRRQCRDLRTHRRGIHLQENQIWSTMLLQHVVAYAKRKGSGCILSFPAKSAKLSSLSALMRTPAGALPPAIAFPERTSTISPADNIIDDECEWLSSWEILPASSPPACRWRLSCCLHLTH